MEPNISRLNASAGHSTRLAEYHKVLFWRDVRFVAWVAAATVLILAAFVK